jgi:predicted lipoprotein with Yx(FWY)xxD motif
MTSLLLKGTIMKTLLLATLATCTLAFTGCTTLKNVAGNDTTGTHEVHSAQSRTAPVASENGVLVDSANHMTLYTFDKDEMNKSNCGAVCLVAWPAFLAPQASNTKGQFSTIQREDGKYQWTMNGKPLYFYANDTKPGDKKGDGKFGTWDVIKTK